ncbi:MAG: zf-HC2 domain-containing protein [Candidatus Eremiobacteraeota bacterium]|nr:zf-HC2 domain-containing protein [Candidatus Eremiobacteraeota bacterium]
MSCSSSEDLFEAYLDGTLFPAQRARLLSHLSQCGACKGLLDELRVVDALISSPRHVELPVNFTFATMAEVRSLPRPHVSSVPVYAYLVSYLVAAWLLIGAGFLFASTAMRAFGETALDVSATFARVFGIIGHAGARVAGDFGALGTLLGAAIVLDVAVVLALVVGFTVVRPRLVEHLRS